jgi:DNA-3-methyladenine glycosylase I
MLDGFQAGLSWSIILRKREAFRQPFQHFNPEAIAKFDEADVARLLADSGIVRSRARIEATIGGARAYLAMHEAGEDFSTFVWSFTKGQPIRNKGNVPASTPLSEEISKALKKRGFKFVGPVIVYAWMQAVGIVNDHSDDCFRRKAVHPGKTPWKHGPGVYCFRNLSNHDISSNSTCSIVSFPRYPCASFGNITSRTVPPLPRIAA